LNKVGESRQPCLTPEVTGTGIIVFLHRDFSRFITCTTGGLSLVPRPLPPEKCLGTRLRMSPSILSKAFLRSTKATNVGSNDTANDKDGPDRNGQV